MVDTSDSVKEKEMINIVQPFLIDLLKYSATDRYKRIDLIE